MTLELAEWGADAVEVAVEVRTERFSGSVTGPVLIDYLVRFRDDLRTLCQTWDHQAYLDGERFSLEIKAFRGPPAPMGPGNWPTTSLSVDGALFDDFGDELEFRFDLIRDELRRVVEALDVVLIVR